MDKQNNIESLGFEGLMSEFQRLHSSLKANNHGEVSRSLSCLRDKYGISGRERFKAIDCILNRLVGVVMPMHYRLLMENASKSTVYSRQTNSSTRCWVLDTTSRAWPSSVSSRGKCC